MSHDPVVPTATRLQPGAENIDQDCIWPTFPPNTVLGWDAKELGVGDICSDGSPPVPITGRVFTWDTEAETIRLPDLVKMEEPGNG